MLKAEPETVNLPAKRDELLSQAEAQIQLAKDEYGESNIEFLSDEKAMSLEFPVEVYPEKVKSLNFDKKPKVEGILQGIK